MGSNAPVEEGWPWTGAQSLTVIDVNIAPINAGVGGGADMCGGSLRTCFSYYIPYLNQIETRSSAESEDWRGASQL